MSKMVIFDRKTIEERDYWIKKLSRTFEPVGLRPDRPRPAVYSSQPQTIALTLPDVLQDQLAELTGSGSFLLYTTLMSALKITLSKYTGKREIAVGSPARKQSDHLSRLSNALVILSDVDGRIQFKDFLLNERQVLLDAYARQHYPFNRLVKDLGLESVTNKCPLFDVAILLEDIHGNLPDLKYDLTVSFVSGKEGLSGKLVFNELLFRRKSVERFAGHFVNVLANALNDTSILISRIEIMSPAERHQLITEWNNVSEGRGDPDCIHRLFEAQVDLTPDSISIICGDEALSYREVNARANQLARRLKVAGVGAEVKVGVRLQRSPDLVVGLLAILKTGGVYVPLDPEHPPERLSFMLEDARIAVLVTESQLIFSLPPSAAACEIICLDSDWAVISNEGYDDLINEAQPCNLAYLIFTSGSTGLPKGVCISHEAAVSHFLAIQKIFDLSADDRVFQFASSSFDVSLEQILPTLNSGAELILRGANPWSATEFIEKTKELMLTVINFPTAYWHQLSKELGENFELGDDWPLRLMIIGGETLLPEPIRLWGKTASHRTCLLNAYGPTEATITSTAYDLSSYDSSDGQSVPIGPPLPPRSCYVLDGSMEVVPVGVIGELHIGGEVLARGYFNRPDLTAEKFIPDQFNKMPGARLYRTGDLVLWLPEGSIEFVGRIDHQVKIRGYRIEIGEIESILIRHPALSELAVVVREDLPGDKRLVAYAVAHRKPEPMLSELRQFLADKLPEYMMPSALVLMGALPTTPSGKIDRQALPEPDENRRESEGPYVAPRTPVEEDLARVWTELLAVERVGVYDNFFELGGHSLLLTQLASHIRKIFQVELPLRDLFDNPTVFEMTAAIAARQIEQRGDLEAAQLLEEIKGLSPAEVTALLRFEEI